MSGFDDILASMRKTSAIDEQLNDDINAVVRASGKSRFEIYVLTENSIDQYMKKGLSLNQAIARVKSEMRAIIHLSSGPSLSSRPSSSSTATSTSTSYAPARVGAQANALTSKLNMRLHHGWSHKADGSWSTKELQELVKESQKIVEEKHVCVYNKATHTWSMPTKGDSTAAAIAMKMYGDLRQQIQDDYYPGKTDWGHQNAIDRAHDAAERIQLNAMVQDICNTGRRACLQPGSSLGSSSSSTVSYSVPDVSTCPGVHFY